MNLLLVPLVVLVVLVCPAMMVVPLCSFAGCLCSCHFAVAAFCWHCNYKLPVPLLPLVAVAVG